VKTPRPDQPVCAITPTSRSALERHLYSGIDVERSRWGAYLPAGRSGAAADLLTRLGCPIREVEVVLGRVYCT
jgi:hypothetical protein